ncbi:phage tail protein [Nocardia arthritidis]|uniref:Phage tail protein n=1 Tax=Nocardia arthritidis TaxID=228602 RepID=A0A6G9YTF6_9NOCA|nr:phage tail protein [Nocardia arthritidis]QIS16498.1 phage tail protein [Nocardia arthritidis]
MPTDTSKVYIPQAPKVKGIIYRAPLGTALPTDAITALPAAFKDLGGISDAGIVNAQARDVKKVKDFAGDIIATPQSDYSETLEVEFVEATNLEVLKAVFGDLNVNVKQATTTSGMEISIDHNSDVLPKTAIVVETIQGTGIRRMVAGIAQPIKVADATLINTDILKYKVTFECFKVVDGQTTFNIREFVNDGKPKAA